jgi:hypothetical protein
MMLAGLGLICWLLMRGKMRGRRSTELPVATSLKHNSNASSSPHFFTGTQSLGAPAEVLKWQVELHELARELKAELDSKLIAVRTMTASYDQAAHRLSELIRLADQVQLPTDSPLIVVRRLAALGWPPEQIAITLQISEQQVQQMLSI